LVRVEIGDEALRDDLIELIQAVIIYKLSHLGREEILSMLQIHDIRESRFYQETLQEGIEKGMTEVIAKLATKKKMTAEEIAALLELDVDLVRQAMTNTDQK
jgi:predicted transposase YdaD